MVTKDGDAKPTTPKRTAAPSATSKPAASGVAAPRAAASPSRIRAAASSGAVTTTAKAAGTTGSKPTPSGTVAKAAAAVKSSPASKPAPGVPKTSAAGGAAATTGGATTTAGATSKTATKTAGPAKATAAKAGGATASGVSKASAGSKAGSGKAGTGKPGARPAGATAAPGKAGTAAPPPAAAVEPAGPDPAEEAARRAELDAKAAVEMEALRRAAWQAQVDYERKQEAKRRQQREEEARRKKEEAALRKSLLEAAYDDDVATLRSGIQRAREAGMLRPDPWDAADARGNTLLSEAAAGGAEEAVRLLLQMGADPNSRGEFLRTPLWRAAFLGKAEVVGPLLEGGADPRIGNEGGELPEHVAPPAIQEVLRGWDVARTEQLLGQLESRRAERAAAVASERARAVRGAEQSVAEAEEAADRAQQALKHAKMELEKRIHEYDTCVEEKKPEGLTQVALDQVHSAERAVDEARRRATEAAEALDEARLQLRREQQQQAEEAGGEAGTEALPGAPVAVKALNDVLIRDVGGVVAGSGKWPLVIDTSGQASVFLRYQDTNYVNALNSRHMEPHMLRRALLGSVRYGKAIVLDLQECDLWPEMPRMFDQVQPGLLSSLLDKSLLRSEAYTSLIRAEDGEEYDRNKFQEARIRAFGFIVLTSARTPNPQLVQQLYPLRVMIND